MIIYKKKKVFIRKSTFFYKLLLCFIVLVELNFFGVISLPSSLDFILIQNRSKWIAPIAILMALWCWNNHKNKELKPYKGFLKKYLIAVTVSVLYLYIDALIRYPLNELITTYGLGTYYFYAFLAIPLIYIFEVEGIDNIMSFLSYVVMIVCCVSIICGVYYLRTGNLLFDRVGDISWTRDNKLRLGISAFGSYIITYSVYKLFNVKTKQNIIRSIFLLVLFVVYTLVTGQSRVALLSLGLSLIVLIYMGDGKKSKKILFMFLVIVAMAFLMCSGYITSLFSSFSTSGDLGGSTIARLSAWEYYLTEFIKNPISAIGFAGDDNYYDIVHGSSGIYYQTVLVEYDYSDCGFVGLMAKTGIFSFIIYIWPLCRYIKMSIRYFKRKQIEPGALIISWVLYLIVTSVTLIVLDADRIIVWPLIISVCEFTWTRRDRELKL